MRDNIGPYSMYKQYSVNTTLESRKSKDETPAAARRAQPQAAGSWGPGLRLSTEASYPSGVLDCTCAQAAYAGRGLD